MIGRLLAAFRPLPEPLAFPPPYRRMLAINSDVEWTTVRGQLNLLEAFARRELELALSFWMFTAPGGTWSMFGTVKDELVLSAEARAFARHGLLDTLHSIGGRKHRGSVEFTRTHIEAGYRVMREAGIAPLVYSNHGGECDTQNIGGDWASYQQGDLPGSEVYHLDLTVRLGVRYFWCDPDYTIDQVTLRPTFDRGDSLFVSGAGRDGRRFIRFRRFLGRLSTGPSLDNLGEQLSQALGCDEPGYTVVYQHLGVERTEDGRPDFAYTDPIRADALLGLDALAEAQRAGEVLVTGTGRLLQHAAMMAARPWSMVWDSRQRLLVRFNTVMMLAGQQFPVDWSVLEGWTIPVSGTNVEVVATLGDETRILPVVDEQGGQTLVGLPWKKRDMAGILEEIRSSSAWLV